MCFLRDQQPKKNISVILLGPKICADICPRVEGIIFSDKWSAVVFQEDSRFRWNRKKKLKLFNITLWKFESPVISLRPSNENQKMNSNSNGY